MAVPGHTRDLVQSLSAECHELVFERLPFKTRTRAGMVSRAWGAAVRTTNLWQTLDLSVLSVGEQTDGALIGAARMAGGRLRSLDLTGQRRLSRDAIVRALEGSEATMTELKLSWIDNKLPKVDDLVVLIQAAPQVTTLVGSLEAAHHEAEPVLRREGAFAHVQLHTLKVDARPNSVPAPGQEALRSLMAAVEAHTRPDGVGLAKLDLINFPLNQPDALAAVVNTVRATPTITALWLAGNLLGPDSVPLLAGVIRRLESFYINNNHVNLLDAETAPVFAAALREAPRLKSFMLVAAGMFSGPEVFAPVFDALTGHPSIEKLFLGKGDAGQHAGNVGRLLGHMVAVNTPALRVVSFRDVRLGDVNLMPLTEALRLRNRVMLEVACGGNRMSHHFALTHFMDAAKACTTLRTLTLGLTEPGDPTGALLAAEPAVEVFVKQRERVLAMLLAAKGSYERGIICAEQLAAMGIRMCTSFELRTMDLSDLTAEVLAAPTVLVHVVTRHVIPLAPPAGGLERARGVLNAIMRQEARATLELRGLRAEKAKAIKDMQAFFLANPSQERKRKHAATEDGRPATGVRRSTRARTRAREGGAR